MSEYAFLRPARLDDLEDLIAFSQEAGPGITSMPQNPEVLEKKLQSSLRAFELTEIIPKHETYLFCLELEGQVVGISGIVSRIGMSEPFFAYHYLYEPQSCKALDIEREIPLLKFVEARKKPTEIGTLFLKPNFRQKIYGKLLSLSRFLFIATFRYRFASTIIAELRGVNDDHKFPFWEALGQKFLDLEFHEADQLRAAHPEYLRELFPKHPIYPTLLPIEAQEVIGKVHERTMPAKKILKKQGFHVSHYVDLFDGGPHLYAMTEEIHAVRGSQVAVVRELRSEIDGETMLVANTKLDFRACIAEIILEEGRMILHPDIASLLNIDIGDPVRYYALH